MNPLAWTENSQLYPASTLSLRSDGNRLWVSSSRMPETLGARVEGFRIQYLYSGAGGEVARGYLGPSFSQGGQVYTLFALGLEARGAQMGVDRAFTERLPLRQELAIREVQVCGQDPRAVGTGSLAVIISGPSRGDVDVVAGDWARRGISQSSLFSGLPVGRVTVVAREVWEGPTLWRWEPSQQREYLLEAYAPLRVEVDYRRVPGTLELEVTGLPPGAAAPISVSGLGSLSLGNGVYTYELAPGPIGVGAEAVEVSAVRYTPEPARASLSLRSLERARATIRYGGEVVQGTLILHIRKEGEDGGVDPEPRVCVRI
ncbi:hypothetical protein, partial [Meiothermus luteus]|uniref:hypothetical protein n=1 Tax=Meiothermus luteus TaxID=2026184 RepID=UPI001C70B216